MDAENLNIIILSIQRYM